MSSELEDALLRDVQLAISAIPSSLRPGGWLGGKDFRLPFHASTNLDKPAVWQFLALDSLRILEDMYFISARWTEPGTPNLFYLCPMLSTRIAKGDIVQQLVKHIETLFSPGWRDRVDKFWLDKEHVVIKYHRPMAAESEVELARLQDLWWNGKH